MADAALREGIFALAEEADLDGGNVSIQVEKHVFTMLFSFKLSKPQLVSSLRSSLVLYIRIVDMWCAVVPSTLDLILLILCRRHDAVQSHTG